MARRILICALWIVFGTVTPARATVGGPETLEVLGYETEQLVLLGKAR